MKRNVSILGILVSMFLVALSQPRGVSGFHASNTSDEAETKILAVLDEMVKAHETYLSVPVKDGRALRLLTEATGARYVVEIGTSTGYSGLWLCLALRKTDGRLTTFEIDHQRATMAR